MQRLDEKQAIAYDPLSMTIADIFVVHYHTLSIMPIEDFLWNNKGCRCSNVVSLLARCRIFSGHQIVEQQRFFVN
jgi:hypothetical protein